MRRRRARPRHPSIWQRGGLSWGELARRTSRQIALDQVFGHAAQLAFHAFFAVFPLLLFLSALLGYMVEESAALRGELYGLLRKVTPSPDALVLLERTVEEIRQSRSGGKLSVGLLATLWLGSSAMNEVSRTLNKAFSTGEKRPWWVVRLASTGLTLVFAALIALGLVLVFYGEAIGRSLAATLGLGAYFLPAWHLAQWLLLVLVVTGSFDLVYNLAPGQSAYRWRWLTPGAVLAVLLWLSASFAFRTYLHHVAYTRIYGSLGAVMVLLIWFYLSAAAILVGGEINSEIWQAERARGATGGVSSLPA